MIKIKDGFILREVLGNAIVVATGKRAKEFNGMINLNSSSAFLWRLLEKGATEEELVKKLLEEFDVSEEVAKADTKAFIEKLREAKLIKE